MVKRQFFTYMDNCYDEYLVTKCPIHKDIYIGSLNCMKCKNFIKYHERSTDDFTDYVMCKK